MGQHTIYRQNAVRIRTTDKDYSLSTEDDQVHVVGTDDASEVTLTLPCNPKLGEEHLLVATSAPIAVESGNGAVITAGYESIPQGHALRFVFSVDACAEDEDDKAGFWIPEQIPNPEP